VATNVPEPTVADWAKRYREAQAKDALTVSDLQDLLNRHLSVWTGPSPFRHVNTVPPTPLQYLPILAPGSPSPGLLEDVLKVTSDFRFRRLCFIKQLSTTFFSLNGDAGHTRYSHTMGVLAVASRYLSTLIGKGTVIPVLRCKAVLLYALLHDYFHGPLGHSLDSFRDVFVASDGRLDKDTLFWRVEEAVHDTELDQQNSPPGEVWQIAHRMCASSADTTAVLRALQDLIYHSPKTERDPLSAIIDGAADADRVDFILRDAIHLGVSERPSIGDIDQLVQGAAFVNGSLAFDIASASVIERLLRCRRQLYKNFYEAESKRVFDEMILKAFYLMLDREGLLVEGCIKDHGVSYKFLSLTDSAFLHFLTELGTRRKHLLANGILHDALRGKRFAILASWGVRTSEFTRIASRKKAIDHELKVVEEGYRSEIAKFVRMNVYDAKTYTKMIQDFTKCFLVGTAEERPKGEALLHLQQLFGGRYLRKRLLERLLWSGLRKRPNENTLMLRWHTAIRKLAEAFAKDGGHADISVSEMMKEIEKEPLVLISLAWIPATGADGLLRHSRGIDDEEVVFHEGGKLVTRKVELKVEASDEDYFVILAAPECIASDPVLSGDVIRTFEGLYESYAWAYLGKISHEATDGEIDQLAERIWTGSGS
jgi:HD superfamily phosphohydrolase